MKGLIIKDFFVLKKQLLPFGAFILVYFFIALISDNSSFFTGMIMVLSAMLPISTFSYDEKSGWNKYALTMPVSKSQLVKSKYLFSGILISTATVLAFLNSLLIRATGNDTDTAFSENLLSLLIVMFIGTLMLSLTLPAIIKFGPEKGRFIILGICIFVAMMVSITFTGVTITSDLVGSEFKADISPAFTFSAPSQDTTFFAFSFLLIAVCVVMFMLSMKISINICEKKEF